MTEDPDFPGVVINIDASKMTPEAARLWVETFKTNTGSMAPVKPVAAPGTLIDQQLKRLIDFTGPVVGERVRAVHERLQELGYTPTLPKSTNKTLPSYISYIDSKSGENFGNLNSTKFYVMRKALRDELAGMEHFGADQRYANIKLVSDDAVDALIKVAESVKE